MWIYNETMSVHVKISVPQFPHRKNGANTSTSSDVVKTEIMPVLKHCLEHGLIDFSYY